MKDKEQTEKESNDSISVYFIENHISTCTPILYLSGDSGGLFGELKKVKEVKYSEPGKSEEFLYTIFCFEIYPAKIKDRGKNELNIKLTLENNNEKLDQKLTITNFEKNNYIYDLEFKPKGFVNKINPPKSHKFPRNKQFEIYKDYLEKDLGIKKKTDKKREDLVFFTQKLLDEKFMFSFYIIIFLESLFTKNMRRHFNYFNEQKIEGIGDLGVTNQRPLTNSINIIRRRPEQVLSGCKDENEKELTGKKLFAFILYYYYEYIKNEFPRALENEDKNAKLYINKVLIDYSHIFLKTKLSKERVQELINVSKTYTQLSNSLQYLDVLSELLDLVETNFQKFKELYKEEEKNKPLIDIESIILPRKEDDIKEICEKYKKLVNMQKKEMKDVSIYISGSLFDKYISYFEGVDVDNLFYIKDIVKSEQIDIKKDIDKSIIETGLILSQKGKMTNSQILNFIHKLIKDNYLKESLEIISGLDIKNFDDKFYEEWKKMNWNNKLEKKEALLTTFTDKVLGLVTNLKDFEILFKLLNISNKPDEIEIRPATLEKMLTKFIELYKVFDFNLNKDHNINNTIISLITYSKNQEKEAEKIMEFLKQIQDIYNKDKINELYSNLLSEKRTILNVNIIKFISEFYTKDSEINIEYFLKILKKCNN